MKIRLLQLIIAFLLIECANGQTQKASKLDTVTNTKIEPFSQICYQETFRKRTLRDRSYQSTGFMIAPNVILTAAHNLYSTSLTKVVNIIIYPGRYKDEYSYDSIEISGETLIQNSIRVHPKFSWGKRDYDFGIIIIPDSLIKKTKHWPTASCFTLDSTFLLKENDIINVAGFPASHGYNGSLMTNQVQRCGTISPKQFAHNFDTQTGNSGSPVWVEKDGKRFIAGIHTYAYTGTKMDAEDIRMIYKWIADSK